MGNITNKSVSKKNKYCLKCDKLFNHKKQSHLYCKSCHKKFIKEFGWGKCHCKNKGIVPMCKCGLLPIGCCYCCPDDTFSISFCSVCI